MTSVLSSQCGILHIGEKFCKSGFNKVYSGLKFVNGRTLSTCTDCKQVASPCRLVLVRALNNDAEKSNEDDESDKKESSKNKDDEVNQGMYREGLERLIGQDDSTFSGVDLATLIRKKYGRSYDVQLIKKEFMGKNLLAMNVMWKYAEQRSFPLTEEEYLLRLDDVANTLKGWGAVSHIRNSLEKLKERPRIGKAVSIFIDMDETGGRANEWIYK